MDIMQAANMFGVPVAIMAAGLIGAWRICRWVTTHVLEPMVQEHVNFLRRMLVSQQQQTETLATLRDVQQQQLTLLTSLVAREQR